MYDAFNAGIEQAAREFDIATPPAALIGVDVLFEPGILIEAEVTRDRSTEAGERKRRVRPVRLECAPRAWCSLQCEQRTHTREVSSR